MKMRRSVQELSYPTNCIYRERENRKYTEKENIDKRKFHSNENMSFSIGSLAQYLTKKTYQSYFSEISENKVQRNILNIQSKNRLHKIDQKTNWFWISSSWNSVKQCPQNPERKA